MKVLVIGGGAREHALCWRLNQSPSVWGLYCAGGNPGTAQNARPVELAPTDVAGLLRFAVDQKIGLTVVGPEDSLAAGIVDEFEREGLKIFGPTAAAARLESSKAFAKTVMREAGVPTAGFAVFDDSEAARRYVRAHPGPLVVKADGLALGKGVTVCEDSAAALAAIEAAMTGGQFGEAGRRLVIEERLSGEEFSFFALCDGQSARPIGIAQDYKTVFDGGRGPNTGGMGAYSPVEPYEAMTARVMREVIEPTLAAMRARGTPYRGVLYAGLMADGERLSVVEFNVRFGDPETQVQMMRFSADLAAALAAACEGRLAAADLTLAPRSAVTVVLASGGYPGSYRTGLPIAGLDAIEGAAPSEIKVKWALDQVRVKVFHAGTAIKDGALVTGGGRVMAVTALAPDIRRAVAAAYQAADMISFEGKHLRRDIARRALAQRSGAA